MGACDGGANWSGRIGTEVKVTGLGYCVSCYLTFLLILLLSSRTAPSSSTVRVGNQALASPPSTSSSAPISQSLIYEMTQSSPELCSKGQYERSTDIGLIPGSGSLRF